MIFIVQRGVVRPQRMIQNLARRAIRASSLKFPCIHVCSPAAINALLPKIVGFRDEMLNLNTQSLLGEAQLATGPNATRATLRSDTTSAVGWAAGFLFGWRWLGVNR
jgi:hypothetical protein